MRKFLLSIFLASAAAAPALADPGDTNDRDNARAERQQAREERQQVREERSSNAERAPAVREEHIAPHAPQLQHPSFDRSARIEQRQDRQQDRAIERNARFQDQGSAKVERDAARDARRDANQANREQIVEQRREQNGNQVGQQEPSRPIRSTPPVVSNTPSPGTQPPLRTVARSTPAPTWSTNWRHNSKYDWHNWRRHHRSWFHLGFYYDPFGWGYQPYNIGWRLWPSYYGSRYWISDPWQYRLPYAPPGTRWVRYYDDALLVDTWTGEVIDVIYNFFW
jgi:Ni/Co efflux regulator RcnB